MGNKYYLYRNAKRVGGTLFFAVFCFCFVEIMDENYWQAALLFISSILVMAGGSATAHRHTFIAGFIVGILGLAGCGWYNLWAVIPGMLLFLVSVQIEAIDSGWDKAV